MSPAAIRAATPVCLSRTVFLSQEALDLGRHGLGTQLDLIAHGETQDRTATTPFPPRVSRTCRILRLTLDRKPVRQVIREPVVTVPHFVHGREQVINERQQFWDGPEAVANRSPRISGWPQAFDVLAGLPQDRDFCVPKSIDRLLSVADEKDRRLDRRVVHEAEPFTPRLNEERDEVPLRSTRVLELIHEDVVVARLELVPALSELVHLPEQLQRTLQDIRKIQQGPATRVRVCTPRRRSRTSAVRRAPAPN